ncbi:hypothetical protein OM419_06660 [Enterobacter roggenkampii]|uniref:hypothetical protein n=1 Tax=Enterobacter roggenkampii TaxID=1812935 RepID=UPI00240E1ACA|nr:hypothetical protein [Enterobacter roggenkampii]WFC88123.1 hypothetical protein OM419_06660 [Enterobacter roggenkampii]
MEIKELGLVKARVELVTAMLKCATAFVVLVGTVYTVLNMAFNYDCLNNGNRSSTMGTQI